MLCGFLNVNKKKGMTSSRVVGKVKGILRAQGISGVKVGHTGTLDPDGEGVLPIAIGRATRLFDYFSEKTKIYYTEFVFGKSTDTLDASGTVIEESCVMPTEADILAVIPSLTGDIDQIPPAYSAKSVDGRRAYDLAREGKEFELRSRRVRIDAIEYCGVCGEGGEKAHAFRVTCGGGTYIRSIARDMAKALGTCGYMRYIRRERSGEFRIADAYTLEELEAGIADKIIPVEAVLKEFKRYDCPQEDARKALNGVKTSPAGMPEGVFRLYFEGELTALAENVGGVMEIKTRLL